MIESVLAGMICFGLGWLLSDTFSSLKMRKYELAIDLQEKYIEKLRKDLMYYEK